MRSPVMLCLLALVAVGCRAGADSPRGVAERFLDAHYVLMDLEGAKRYCTGLALAKVDEELQLVGTQVIDESTRRPHVSYELSEERVEAEGRSTLVYNGSVRVSGGDTFAMRWLINTRRDGDGTWQVSNFKEFQ